MAASPDPLGTDTQLQNAIKNLSPGTGTPLDDDAWPYKTTLPPGTYSGMDISNGTFSVALQPGLYTINGNVNIGSGINVTGTGVTIVTSGTVTIANGANVQLSAPGASASGGIPGILFAGSSTSVTLAGGASTQFSGVVYYPNGALNINNGSSSFSPTCLEYIGSTITLAGGAKVAGNCPALPGGGGTAASVSLVQ